MRKLNIKNPLFSIVIPTRDRPALLKILLDSILKQNFDNFEIIIANNSKSNETSVLLESYNNKRIILIKNKDVAMDKNWNSGIQKARGKYLLLFSDKMFLKKGALTYLSNYMHKNTQECLIWGIDKFYLQTNEYEKNQSFQQKSVLSADWLRGFFTNSLDTYPAPCHCNSCVPMSIVKKILKKTGKLCMKLNPDYTMAFQILLNTKKIHQIKNNLTVLLYPNDKVGFGNGTSFWQKTNKYTKKRDFIKKSNGWFKNNNLLDGINLKFFYMQDLILRDLHNILKIYSKNLDEIISKINRKCNYFANAYRETIRRQRSGVNLDKEFFYLKKIFNNTDREIKEKLYFKIKFLICKLYFIKIFLFFKKNKFFSFLLDFAKKSLFKKKVVFYSIDEAYQKIKF